MIDIKSLKESDKGRWVKYTAHHGAVEFGRIKSWNEKFIFVVYKCANLWDQYQNYTGCATHPEDLEFHEQ